MYSVKSGSSASACFWAACAAFNWACLSLSSWARVLRVAIRTISPSMVMPNWFIFNTRSSTWSQGTGLSRVRVTFPVTFLSIAKFLPLISLKIRKTFLISVSKKSSAIFSPVYFFWGEISANLSSRVFSWSAAAAFSTGFLSSGFFSAVFASAIVPFSTGTAGVVEASARTFFHSGRSASSYGFGGMEEAAKLIRSMLSF